MTSKINSKDYKLIDHLFELYYLAHTTAVEKTVNERNIIKYYACVDALQLLGYEVKMYLESSKPVIAEVQIRKANRLLISGEINIESAMAFGYEGYEVIYYEYEL